MKHISKSEPPKVFTDWIKKRKPVKWNDIHEANSQAVYQVLAESLFREQGEICCYCEQRLTREDSHIEHFYAKGLPEHAKRVFDYSNLMACCNGDYPKNRNDKHCCGQKRANHKNGNADLPVSPLDEQVESCFKYNHQGHILPVNPENKAIDSMIDILGLNCSKLVRLRNAAYATLILEQNYLEESDFSKLVQSRLVRNSEGQFEEFWSVVHYFFGS